MSGTTRTAREEIEYARGILNSQREVFAGQQFDEQVYVFALNQSAEAALRRALEKLDKGE